MKGQPFYKRLGFALNGLRLAFIRERSFRYHVWASIVVIATLFITKSSPAWWVVGMFTLALVLVTELMNSAFEALIDHLHPEHHDEIKVVKDIAAGAVLLSSIVAVLIALVFIFSS